MPTDPKNILNQLEREIVEKFTRKYSRNQATMQRLKKVVEGDEKVSRDYLDGYKSALYQAMRLMDPKSEDFQALEMTLGYVLFRLSQKGPGKNNGHMSMYT